MIMTRTKGLMRFRHAFIQHLNPACRAAHYYPHLPSSRLIMALNDFDLPASYISELEKQSSFDDALKALSLLGLVFVFVLTLLPESLQDAALEGNVNGVIGLMLLLLANLLQVSVALPIAVVVVAVALLLLREYLMNKKRVKVTKITAPVILPEEEEINENDLALVNLHQKPKHERSKDFTATGVALVTNANKRQWSNRRQVMIIPADEAGMEPEEVIGRGNGNVIDHGPPLIVSDVE